jgi:hypothetical protein
MRVRVRVRDRIRARDRIGVRVMTGLEPKKLICWTVKGI